METVKQKIIVFFDVLKMLEKSIHLFDKYTDIFEKNPTEDNKDLFISMRNSMIQCFKYSTDLFWKVAEIYLEDVEKITLLSTSPRGIVRAAVNARVFSEVEGEQCMDMVESRNKTSHTYHEVTADEVAHEIPGYYEIMETIIDRMQNNSNS